MVATNPNDSESLAKLRALVAPVCSAHGVDLVDARFTTDGGRVLRVLIERPGADPATGAGVTLSDCSAVSRQLSGVLDENEAELPGGAYRLEVGSPGLERPLFSVTDFERFAGREAKLETHEPVAGRRRFSGTLAGIQPADAADNPEQATAVTVRFEQDGQLIDIPHGQIARAHLVHRF